MSQKQFDERCKKHGFVPEGFLGYYRIDKAGTSVSVLNAGPMRRQKLAYLIQRAESIRKEKKQNECR